MNTSKWGTTSVLVTGAGGFIGSHLCESLVRLGAKTRAFVHYNSAGKHGWLEDSPVHDDIEVVLGDVRDANSLRRALRGIDVVFHLAALIGIPYSYEAAYSYVQTNIEGTLNVLQGALDSGVTRVVHTSTSEVYGSARQVPISEDHPLQGQSPYSATKIAADKLAESFYLSFGLPVVTVRPFNTYGPRQSARAVIPTIVTQALSNSIVRLGSLSPKRDFTYVEDTADGFIRAACSEKVIGTVVNLGSGREVSIGELAELIFRLSGRPCKIEAEINRKRPEKSEVVQLLADNRKARHMMGWQPRCSLEEGLTQTIAWIQNNKKIYKVGTYAI